MIVQLNICIYTASLGVISDFVTTSDFNDDPFTLSTFTLYMAKQPMVNVLTGKESKNGV
ncbi:MAG: hypothetical protein ACRC4N_06225 [Gammaproteobacteria bacterium]